MGWPLEENSRDCCFRQSKANVSTGKLSIDLIIQGLEIAFQFSPWKPMMSFLKSHTSSLNFHKKTLLKPNVSCQKCFQGTHPVGGCLLWEEKEGSIFDSLCYMGVLFTGFISTGDMKYFIYVMQCFLCFFTRS